jgi:hypothetical protein
MAATICFGPELAGLLALEDACGAGGAHAAASAMSMKEHDTPTNRRFISRPPYV